jgi:hypothetical protein
MGCDITMHSQVYDIDRWVWYDFNIFDDRNYTLYGILCGCRGTEFKPIADWKGYPEDCEDKLKKCGPWDYDYVTESGVNLGYAGVSWLTLTELKTFDWKQKIPGMSYTMRECSFVKEVLQYLEACAERFGGPDNVRIVFGFSV